MKILCNGRDMQWTFIFGFTVVFVDIEAIRCPDLDKKVDESREIARWVRFHGLVYAITFSWEKVADFSQQT